MQQTAVHLRLGALNALVDHVKDWTLRTLVVNLKQIDKINIIHNNSIDLRMERYSKYWFYAKNGF